MDIFLKAVSGILIAVLLNICLSRQSKDFSMLLTVFVCCAVACGTVSYLKQIIDFVKSVNRVAQIDGNTMIIVLKVVGIGILGEIVSQICTDSGNASLGRMLQVLTSAVVLWLSLPLFTALLETVEGILVAV